MTIKADAEIERLQNILGASGEVEIVPMFVPIQTYRILLQIGKERGLSPADVISNALVQYLQPKPALVSQVAEITRQPVKQPDIVIKRRK